MNRPTLTQATLLTLIVAGAACAPAGAEPRPELPAKPDKKTTPLPERLTETRAEPRGARGLALTGRTRANRESSLATTVSGRVEEVRFEAGQHVEDGAIMVRLDAAQARLTRDRAEAALEVARAHAQGTARERDRLGKVASRGAVTEADLDRATTGDDVAQAQVAQAEAALALAAKGVSDTLIRAPFSGIVLERKADPGEWVNVNSNAVVARVADVDPLEIALEAPEHLLGRIEVGAEVEVHFSATGQDVTAKISRVVRAVDPASHSFEVVAEVPNPDHTYVPGLFAEARLVEGDAK